MTQNPQNPDSSYGENPNDSSSSSYGSSYDSSSASEQASPYSPQPYGTGADSGYGTGSPYGRSDAYAEARAAEAAGGPVPLHLPRYGCGPIEATTRFFKKYVAFSGYASRSEYWWAMAVCIVATLIPMALALIILAAAGAFASPSYDASGMPVAPADPPAAAQFAFVALLIITLLINLAILIPSISVSWRRFHDAGFTGLLYLLSLVPYIGGLVVLVFMILPTKPEKHRAEWDAPATR